MKKQKILLGLFVLFIAGSWVFYEYGRSIWFPGYLRLRGKQSVESVVKNVGPESQARLIPYFEKAEVPYPPEKITLIVLKDEKRVELWASRSQGWAHIRDYDIFAASGHAGPKLRQGDRQVPEGDYRIIVMNPNSSYHLSMKINYPNSFDHKKANLDKRTNLGGDIFIHGQNVSIGCIALGDIAIEELFVLVTKIGKSKARVLVLPNDLRSEPPLTDERATSPWLNELYAMLSKEVIGFERKHPLSPTVLLEKGDSVVHSQKEKVKKSGWICEKYKNGPKIPKRKVL
jgi:hypothetical protein